MKWFQWILSPLSLIYWFITDSRNRLYDSGILKETKFNLPVIGIGNITVGGTGKTPHCEYVGRIFSKKNHIAVLSKGYGRKTTNFKYVELSNKSFEVGDEPLQTKHNFPDQIIAVDHKRVKGIQKIIKDFPKIKTIILDDAFQHRSVKIGFNILLCDYNNPIFEDYIMPLGKLRENRKGVKRADCVIVTKCPESLEVKEAIDIEKKLNCEDVFFTKIKYDHIISVYDHLKIGNINNKSVILVTGIANSEPILKYLKTLNVNSRHLKYSDHYNYNTSDVKRIISNYNEITRDSIILTTEKDAQKLREFKELSSFPLYYLKVSVDFLWNKDKFEKKIKDYVESYS